MRRSDRGRKASRLRCTHTKMNSNAPVICLCGISDPSPALYDVGIDAVFALCDRPMLPADSLKNTALLARKAAFNIAGLVSALKH